MSALPATSATDPPAAPADAADAADTRAVWSAAYVNSLADSAFAAILPGGTKDAEGKTVPRSLRLLPHHDASGAVDPAHLRDALARGPQAALPPALRDGAMAHLRRHAAAMGIGDQAQRQGQNSAAGAAGAAGPLAGIECRRLGASGLELEVRAAGRGAPAGQRIVGYAAVFDSPTVIRGPLGDFVETVRPGAFTRTIERDDVRALFNHDESLVLGRTRAGTLRLAEDRHGLRMEIDPPDTEYGRTVVELVRRGDVTGASFGFVPAEPGGQRWHFGDGSGGGGGSEMASRELLDVRLFDVSPVTFPAYEEAEVASRAASWARRALAGWALDPAERAVVRRFLDFPTLLSSSSLPFPPGCPVARRAAGRGRRPGGRPERLDAAPEPVPRNDADG